MKSFTKFLGAMLLTVMVSGCAVYPSPQAYNTHLQYSNQGYNQAVGRTVAPVQVVNTQPQQPQYYVDAKGNRYVDKNGKFVQVQPSTQPQYQQQYQQPQYVQQYQQPQYQQQYQQPQYVQQYQQPQYQQQYQQPQYRSQPSTGGAVIGGAVGGLALSGVGRGNGNLAAIAAGSATGSVVGAGCRTVNGGQVLGAIVGGLLGSQVGGGSGRQVATAIGSSTGALVGNDMAGGCLGQ